jgi:quercetin dioxygenase-like cupin family protein
LKKKANHEQEEIAAQSKTMVDLVSYQDGSVVSRTLVDKKAGTITLFAFDQRQGLSEHTAPYDAMVYVVEGEASVVISGKAIRLVAGEMTVMPAGEPHSLLATKKFKMLLIIIKS